MSWDAIIREVPETAHLRQIFGASLPVADPLPQRGEGFDRTFSFDGEFYRLDVGQISTEQRARLVEYLAWRFKLDPKSIEHMIDDPKHGVPIKAEHLVVPMDLRYFV